MTPTFLIWLLVIELALAPLTACPDYDLMVAES